jgi:DnaJ-class molecular chaperone
MILYGQATVYMKDLYDILGLSSKANADDIKVAYRSLARERHPDRDQENPNAEEDFKQLTQAYSILSDPKSRAKYDRGDIDASGARRAASRPRARRETPKARKPDSARTIKVNGADVEYDLKVSFMDAAKGCVKYVSITNGKRLKVNIPAATADASVLRLKAQGIPGIGGGRDGAALVSIEVLPDPTFRREETDILVDLPVSLHEAVLGARVDAPTIDGPVSVTVPPNSNTGTILRLKGKGLSLGKDDDARGDQYVTLKVVLPRKPDPELVEFIKSWSPSKDYAVRPKTVKS